MKKLLLIALLAARGAAADPMDDFDAHKAQMDRDFDEAVQRDETHFWQFTIFVFGGVVIFGVIAAAISADRRRTLVSTSYEPYTPAVTPSGDMADVSVLRIAIDGRASKFVRSELARIDKLADATTPGGRLARLREIGVMLRRVRDAWVYGGAVNEPMRSVPESMTVFRQHADDARTRMTRNVAPEVSGPDQSLILISIVVVARGELATVSAIGAGEELRRALEAAAYRAPDELLALDVIVAPADPDQTLSSIRLAALYPQPELFPIQGALVGKTFCTYCGGPFPAELVSCPHCGAPAPGRDRSAA